MYLKKKGNPETICRMINKLHDMINTLVHQLVLIIYEIYACMIHFLKKILKVLFICMFGLPYIFKLFIVDFVFIPIILSHF